MRHVGVVESNLSGSGFEGLRIAKELPSSFHLPGKQAITEQVVYALLYNVLSALTKTGVAVCGGPVVQPLAGRTEGIGPRN